MTHYSLCEKYIYKDDQPAMLDAERHSQGSQTGSGEGRTMMSITMGRCRSLSSHLVLLGIVKELAHVIASQDTGLAGGEDYSL